MQVVDRQPPAVDRLAVAAASTLQIFEFEAGAWVEYGSVSMGLDPDELVCAPDGDSPGGARFLARDPSGMAALGGVDGFLPGILEITALSTVWLRQEPRGTLPGFAFNTGDPDTTSWWDTLAFIRMSNGEVVSLAPHPFNNGFIPGGGFIQNLPYGDHLLALRDASNYVEDGNGTWVALHMQTTEESVWTAYVPVLAQFGSTLRVNDALRDDVVLVNGSQLSLITDPIDASSCVTPVGLEAVVKQVVTGDDDGDGLDEIAVLLEDGSVWRIDPST